MKETEKALSGFKQHSFENLLEEQNLLSENLPIYKVPYTPILSAPKSGNPHPELFAPFCRSRAALQLLGWKGTYSPEAQALLLTAILVKACSHFAFGMVFFVTQAVLKALASR